MTASRRAGIFCALGAVLIWTLGVAPGGAAAASPACPGGIPVAPPNPPCFIAFGSPGSGAAQLLNPRAVAVDQKGFVYVADSGNSRIQKFTNLGAHVGSLGPSIPGGTNLSTPTGVAVDDPPSPADDPNIYVADANGHVQKLSPTGAFLKDFGTFGQPVGVDVDDVGHVLVTDIGTGKHILATFTPDGTLLNVFGVPGGGPGSGPGQFNTPRDVATDPTGDLYVADAGNNRMQRLAPTGAFLSQTTGLTGAAGLDHAIELVTGNLVDRLWVTAPGLNQFFKLDSTGTIIQTEGGAGAAVGQFSGPYGLSVDCDGNVFVSDPGNGRVQRLGDSDVPPCSPPGNSVSPSISGQAQAGSMLTLNPGTWTGSPTPALSFRWQRCASLDPASCGDIAGQRNATYQVTDADRGFRLRAVVVGANTDGTTAEATDMTAVVPPVQIAPLPPSPPGNPPPTLQAPPAQPVLPAVTRTGIGTFTVSCPVSSGFFCEVSASLTAKSRGKLRTLASTEGSVNFNQTQPFALQLTKVGRNLLKAGLRGSGVFQVTVDETQVFTANVRLGRNLIKRLGVSG